jgi:hypothetical protein
MLQCAPYSSRQNMENNTDSMHDSQFTCVPIQGERILQLFWKIVCTAAPSTKPQFPSSTPPSRLI